MALSDDVAARIASAEQAKRAKHELSDPGITRVAAFFAAVVTPAFDQLEAAMIANGRSVRKTIGQTNATFVVLHGGVEELSYTIARSHGLDIQPSRHIVDGARRQTLAGSFGPSETD